MQNKIVPTKYNVRSLRCIYTKPATNKNLYAMRQLKHGRIRTNCEKRVWNVDDGVGLLFATLNTSDCDQSVTTLQFAKLKCKSHYSTGWRS